MNSPFQSLQKLKTNEVYTILKSPVTHILEQLPQKSDPGTYFLIRPKQQRGWKKDGYTYLPRYNGIGTREDVEKLKINGHPVIVCLYSFTIPQQGSQFIICRRIYKLLDENSDLYLVHYLQSSQKNIVQEQEEQYEEPYNNIDDYLLTNHQTNYLNDSMFAMELFQEDEISLQNSNNVLLQEIQVLEQRVIQLEQEKNTITSTTTQKDSLDEINLSFKESQLKIVDFSPEWDYVEGGAKFILCYQPLKEIQNVSVFFGQICVEAICVQPGVIKCQVPPNLKGKYRIAFSTTTQLVEDTKDTFEYIHRKSQRKKKEKSKVSGLNDQYEDKEVKVRVIEKLTSFQQFFNSQTNSASQKMDQELTNIDDINDSILNSLIEQCIQLGHQAKLDLGEFFDQLDIHELSLLHYLIVLNYQISIKTMIRNGGNINIQGKDGLTGLQLAIILQNEQIVNLLIQLGAIDQSFNEQDKPLDNIFQIDQVYGNKQILDLIVRGYTLCDSIHNSSSYTEQQSWNEQDDQEEGSFLQIKDLFEGKDNQFSSPIYKLEEKQTKHKYYRNYNKCQNQKQKQQFSTNIVYDTYQDHIKVIQKNVRAWLLRRQYLDIKYATQVLQHYMRNKLIKKTMNPDCKDKIKSTVRNWLNLKD